MQTETLTRTPEQQQLKELAVGQMKFVLRNSGAVTLMEIKALSEPEPTFDEHNQPTDERMVTMVGLRLEMIETPDGERVVGYPSKTIAEEYLSDSNQQKYQEKFAAQHADQQLVVRSLGSRSMSRISSDTFQIPALSTLK